MKERWRVEWLDGGKVRAREYPGWEEAEGARGARARLRPGSRPCLYVVDERGKRLVSPPGRE